MNTMREGFTLIEVIIAMLILTVGILAMGASTGYVLNQIRGADLRDDRAHAVRHVAETLRGTPAFDATCNTDVAVNDRYTVRYECVADGSDPVRVVLISTGPGISGGRIQTALVDTTVVHIRR
jgi:prepilin-type N-terminal cleavage/methylation domain-containing protein